MDLNTYSLEKTQDCDSKAGKVSRLSPKNYLCDFHVWSVDSISRGPRYFAVVLYPAQTSPNRPLAVLLSCL